MTRFSLPIETLQSITELLIDADTLITDGDTLQKLRDQFGANDSTYLWAQQTRALLKEMKHNIQPVNEYNIRAYQSKAERNPSRSGLK
jgi:hypothetical protein